MDKSSRRPPPPPPDSTPAPMDPPAPPLPKRNQPPVSTKATLDDCYEDMNPPKVVSPAHHRKYGSTQQPVGLLGDLVCLENKLQFNKPDVPKWMPSLLDKDRKISEPLRPLQALLPFSVEKVRRATVGESTHPMHEISDETYEIPEVNKNPEPRLPSRPDQGASTFARPPPHDYDSDDGDWDDEEWDDAQTDTKQGEGLYIVPDGGNVEDDPAPPPPPPNNRRKPEQIQQPSVPQVNSKALLISQNKTAQNTMAEELKAKFTKFQNNKPTPPPKTDKKPQPPAKPVEVKPQLPPRNHDKLPSMPPIDTTDSTKPDDSSSAGSTSSGSTPSSKPLIKPSGPVIRNQAKVPVLPPLHGIIKIIGGLSKIPKQVPNDQQHESDEIYDDAATENLPSFDWFHGELDRNEAEKRVKDLRENGAFLVRTSSKPDETYPYVLVVLTNGNIKNLRLRQRNDKRFAIGYYKEDEVSFTTVPDLVNHHKTNNIKLADGGAVMLTRTPQK